MDALIPSTPSGLPLTVSERCALLCATVAGIGHLRPAPGTWGSLAAAAAAWVWLAAGGHGVWLIAASLIALAIGVITVPVAIRHFRRGDPAHVVIDEVAGVWLAVGMVPTTHLASDPAVAVLLAFLLFRYFDICKPWPVAPLERLPGSWGVMADDMLAGALTGVLVVAIMG